jgi:PhnB protein
MELEPYLCFYGRCEEALNFYKEAFRGEITTLNRVEGSPMESHVPPEDKKKIMHANFKGPGFQFMASDGQSNEPVKDSNVSLSLGTEDVAEAQRVFDKLAEGGVVQMPIQDAFWGGQFGMLTDKFGIVWMMTTSTMKGTS